MLVAFELKYAGRSVENDEALFKKLLAIVGLEIFYPTATGTSPWTLHSDSFGKLAPMSFNGQHMEAVVARAPAFISHRRDIERKENSVYAFKAGWQIRAVKIECDDIHQHFG